MRHYLIFLGLAFSALAHAGTYYKWTGAQSTSWGNNANWSPNGSPGTDPTDIVEIGMTVRQPVLDKNRTVGKLILSSQLLNLNGFTLTVAGGGSVLTSGGVYNGNFTYPAATTSVGSNTILSSANSPIIGIGTFNIATTFGYLVTGAGYNNLKVISSGAGSEKFLSLTIGATTKCNLIINNPADPTDFATLQITYAQGGVTDVAVVRNGNVSSLWNTTYCTMYGNQKYVSLSGNIMSVLFPTCTPQTIPQNENFVRTQVPQIECTNATMVDNLSFWAVLQKADFLDGLGRVVQTVARQASPRARDLVQIYEYDGNGRTPKQYLPFTSDGCSGANIYQPTAKLLQQNFYTVNLDPLLPKVSDPASYDGTQNNAYTEIVFDGSPLDRVAEVAAPGDAWRILRDANGNSTGMGKTAKQNARTNTSADKVALWVYDPATGNASAGSSATPNYYPAASLFVTETLSEDGLKTASFTDKLGRTVLTRVYKDASTNMDTYTVFDDFGRTVYTVTPKASSLLAGQNWTVTPTGAFTKTWLYANTYDERGRVQTQKNPGTDPTKVVYDLLDRPIMVQDAMQAAMTPTKQWSFAKYDLYGRKVLTGLHMDNGDRASFQTAANASTALYETHTATGGLQGYTNNAIPNYNVTESSLLTAAFYDDYDFDNNGTADHTDQLYYSNAFQRVRGKATGTRTRNLETNAWRTKAAFYDKYGRTVQVRWNNQVYQSNHPTSADLEDSYTAEYDFYGRLLASSQVHTPGGLMESVYTENSYEYDHVGRLLKTTQTINGASTPTVLAKYAYNELGQPVGKDLGADARAATPVYLQSVDYRYNIRGWLTGINNASLTNDLATNNDGNDLFGMELSYEQAAAGVANTPRYGGDVTAVRWKSNNALLAGSGNQKAYTYDYDGIGQMAYGSYDENLGTGWGAVVSSYKESAEYDLNGNISLMVRTGKNGARDVVDYLSYGYTGNQLTAVAETGDKGNGFKQAALPPSQQYAHDPNGNLATDANRGISLSYNHLNLTVLVQGTAATNNTERVAYAYDASGQKLKKTYTKAGIATVTVYVDNFVYDATGGTYKLLYMATPEGRALAKAGGTFAYEYTISDHLGSARLSFDKGPDGKARVVQEDAYYPFGGRIGAQGYVQGIENLATYSGEAHEKQLLNQYDYGWRQYDPTLGRWHAQDPMQQFNSAYAFVGNNPATFYDVAGLYGYSGYSGMGYSGSYSGGAYAQTAGCYGASFSGSGAASYRSSGPPDAGITINMDQQSAGIIEGHDGKTAEWFYTPSDSWTDRGSSHQGTNDYSRGGSRTGGDGGSGYADFSGPTGGQSQQERRQPDPEFQEPYKDWADLNTGIGGALGLGEEYIEKTYPSTKAVRLTEKSTYIRYANTGKVLKYVGRGLLLVGVGFDIFNVINNNGNRESWVRLGVGSTITAIGFVPVIGLPTSIVLGAIEIGGGFDGLYDAAAGR